MPARKRKAPASARISAVIVEDSPADRLNLETLLAGLPGIDLVGQAASATEAAELLRRTKPDVVFLDIELRRQSGFNLVKELRERPENIVLTTVHRQFAEEAFEIGAIDYVVKPVTEERLLRALSRLKIRAGAGKRSLTEELEVHRGGGMRHRLPVEAISAVRAERDCSRILCGAREYADRRSFRDWQELLEGKGFVVLGRSHMMRLDHVVAWQPYGSGGSVTLRNAPEPYRLGRAAYRRLVALLPATAP